MGEKRKLPPRGRGGSATKKRISEAPAAETPPGNQKATPTRASQSEPREVELPTKVKDGQSLPTVPKPQHLGLSSEDYQSYAESGVIAAALQRSRAKWLQDSIFEKYWVKPSKRKSQPPPTFQNPSRESMVKLGACTIVIEPHHFDAVLYAVRDPRSQPQPQTAAQGQRPIVQYTLPANPDNFHQFQPRPPINQGRVGSQQGPPNQSASPYSPSPQPQPTEQSQQSQPPQSSQQPPQPQESQQPPQRPQPTQSQQLPRPQQPQQRHEPPSQKSTSTSAPPPPATAGPPREASAPIAAAPPAQAPSDAGSQASKPNPDPVIQMLATRAATNPDLKSLMRVVASSEASQEQLLAFQAHIDELNAILASRQKGPPPTSTAPPPQTNGVSSPAPGTPSAPSPGPAAAPAAPPVQNAQPSRLPPPMYPRPPQSSAPPPIRSKSAQQGTPQQPAYFQQQRPPPQPKQDIKAVALEFVPPAGSTAAAHGASGDRYLFPANTILDYFPGRTTVIASFLVTKKFDPSAPNAGLAGSQATGKAKAKKPKKASDIAASTPADTSLNDAPSQTPAPNQSTQAADTDSPSTVAGKDSQPAVTDSNLKEYYQPVTMRLHANSSKILDPLSRVVKPPAEVRQYMNDVMDRVDRAHIEYLAMRLPRERAGRGATEEQTAGETDGGAMRVIKNHNNNVGGSAAKTKAKDAELGTVAKQETADEDDGEELLDVYDMPSGLVPLS